MRLIKFRAWDKYGGLIGNGKMTFLELNTSYLVNPWDNPNINIMQFTGLTDKNGREIWEGDIVKHGQSILKVVYEAPSFIMPLTKNGKRWLTFDLSKREPQFVEVLGNIYENSALLK